jgi:glycosyltransferase involved in cell wall biosynthesis
MSAENDEHRVLPRTLAGATILQIVPSLRDDAIGRTAVNVAYSLLQAGARAIIASDAGPLVDELKNFGGEWFALVNAVANPIRIRRNAGILESFISGERVDVLHAHSPGAAWSALTAIARLPVWLVTNLPDQPAPRSRFGAIYLSSVAHGDRVIASSAYLGARMAERYDIPRENLVVIPRSIDTNQFDPAAVSSDRVGGLQRSWGVRDGERIVLVPGPLAPWNGQTVLVDAAKTLINGGMRGVAFVLIGDQQSQRKYARTVASRIAEQGIEGFVRLVGPCPDMPAALATADLVVVPAVEPPLFGRMVAEAQAMARPVITSAVGVLQENIVVPPRMPEDLRTGWLTRPGDAVELARAINVALSLDATSYAALAARARQFAEYMFSPQSIAAAHRGVYTALLARDR